MIPFNNGPVLCEGIADFQQMKSKTGCLLHLQLFSGGQLSELKIIDLKRIALGLTSEGAHRKSGGSIR